MCVKAITTSNTFRVRDNNAFLGWCALHGLIGLPQLRPDSSDHWWQIASSNGGWPQRWDNPMSGEEEELSIAGSLAVHLHEEDVAVLYELQVYGDAEPFGEAVAVNAYGVIERVGLSDIQRLAEKLKQAA